MSVFKPNFFNNSLNRATYPQNDSIPDIIEEMWHGVQFWKNRYHEGVRKFFDSTCLGNHQQIRWTVFGPPQYEDFFGGYNGEPGRWIHDETDEDDWDNEEDGSFTGQFIGMRNGSWIDKHGSSIVGFLASFINICDTIGWFPCNRTELLNLTLDARDSYKDNITATFDGVNCELEMYKLTGNISYLHNASFLAESIINSFSAPVSNDEFLNLACALDFADRYNGTLITLANSNNIFDTLWSELEKRTAEDDGKNIFRYLRIAEEAAPTYQSGDVFTAMLAACYGFNMTTNNTQKQDFFNFITRHYDWTFGWNFENTCLLEGVPGGDNYVFQYHSHRYRFISGIIRGGCPGFIVDGFERFPGDIGTSKDFCNVAENGVDCNDPNLRIIEPETNLYTETWSDVQFRYMMMNGAFHRLVLERN